VLAEEGIELAGARALVLGSGAAARAALVALELVGADAAVAARDPGRADEIAREFGVPRVTPADSERCQAVINATPGGPAVWAARRSRCSTTCGCRPAPWRSICRTATCRPGSRSSRARGSGVTCPGARCSSTRASRSSPR
jgi:hypothetical protein